MVPHRLRLKFDDSILTDSQKSEGLKRSWVLVEPTHHTISDFISHLLHSFNLWDSCPHGIFLTMEGFALPHFESIELLNGNGLVCVKRTGSKFLDGIKESCEDDEDIVIREAEKKLPLTRNEESEKETGGYLSEAEDDEEENVPNGDASCKKRKASKQLKSSKNKRKCKRNDSSSSGKENADCYFQNGYCQKNSPTSKQDPVHKSLCNNTEDWEGTATLCSEPDGTVNVSVSRSTKRKKTQRLRRQALRIAEQEQLLKIQSQGEDLGDEIHLEDTEQDSSEPEGDLVPVVVRPGHIYFAAPGKEKAVQQFREAEIQRSLSWHGITNKKKGQKWGKEKQLPSKRNEHKDPCEKQPSSKWNEWRSPKDKQPESNWNKHKSPQEKQSANTWDGNRSTGGNPSGSKWNGYTNHGRSWATQKAPRANPLLEFEKMVPMTDFPVQGDTIAYRLLEMSSSLIPQLTSYRVGKVSCSDPEANTVQLVPVPEYPFEFKKTTDCTPDELDDASRYKEDGSLEIDFPSLADVRVVKHNNMITSSSFHQMANGTPASGWAGTSAWTSASQPSWRTETLAMNSWTGVNTDVASTSTSTSENGKKDVWEEMSAAMNAKKEERLKEDNWNKKPKPVNYSWSQKTFRGRAQYGR